MGRETITKYIDRARSKCLKGKEYILIMYKKAGLCCEGGEALEHITQRNHQCPIPESIPSQIGWGFA